MSFTVLISFIIYSFVTSITPGPNNIMLAASGVNFGFKRSIPHILGIGIGFGFMVSVVGFGFGALISSNIVLYESLKIIGITYLLYLAYKIYHSTSVDTTSGKTKPLTFLQAAMFQWVNPKAWIMAMGAVTTYLSSQSELYWYLIIGVIYGAIGIPSTGVWALVGEKLQKYIHDQKKLKMFNAVMALLLVLSVIQPLIDFLFFIVAFASEI
ncbi:LysE family translocator [Acinetobacter shaoyimingii]|uniref:LysE family translocator n=1 Tax=Acinetobacter shaoyimingii TaxID=2715164 RepID=A0A6G8RU13_9GAMM|nr:LysE family translocator [Acinetobacter shaoyimingii]QIO05404.1 LysE family translocator [Acinetobacter shaoyimingii]